MTCPHCERRLTTRQLLAHLTPAELPAIAAAHRATLKHGGTRAGAGRPLSDAPRCPCGQTTLALAEIRGRSEKHKPDCAYYKPPTAPRRPSQ